VKEVSNFLRLVLPDTEGRENMVQRADSSCGSGFFLKSEVEVVLRPHPPPTDCDAVQCVSAEHTVFSTLTTEVVRVS